MNREASLRRSVSVDVRSKAALVCSLMRHSAIPRFLPLMAGLCFCVASRGADAPPETYEYGPDSLRHEGVPRGTVTKHLLKSTVFPGTIREYHLYVPAQYNKAKPAAVMIFQDGHTYLKEDGDFRVPVVLDNLIHQGAMPVTIGIFINPGWNPILFRIFSEMDFS